MEKNNKEKNTKQEDLNKFDLHIHSKYSWDAKSDPKKTIKQAKIQGLTGIAITDHDTTKGWSVFEKLAKENNLVYIKGEEITLKKNEKTTGHALALFINQEIKSKDLYEIADEVRAQDGILIAAHPFERMGPPFFLNEFTEMLKNKKFRKKTINGVETFNGRIFIQKYNQKAKNIANKYKLLQTAGSDAHEVDAIGRGYITTYAETEHELIKQIKRKKNLVNGTPSSLWQACRSYVYSLNCIMTK